MKQLTDCVRVTHHYFAYCAVESPQQAHMNADDVWHIHMSTYAQAIQINSRLQMDSILTALLCFTIRLHSSTCQWQETDCIQGMLYFDVCKNCLGTENNCVQC